MSISLPPSSNWATDEWDALVAREVVRQGGIEAAFDYADACERVGDLQLALEWLDRAGRLSGGLSPACRAQRAGLAHKLTRQPLIGPRSELGGTGDAGAGDGLAFRLEGGREAPRTCVWFESDFER
jgi:hypothetical protein